MVHKGNVDKGKVRSRRSGACMRTCTKTLLLNNGQYLQAAFLTKLYQTPIFQRESIFMEMDLDLRWLELKIWSISLLVSSLALAVTPENDRMTPSAS